MREKLKQELKQYKKGGKGKEKLEKKWAKEEKERKKEHIKFVKEMVLEYVKGGCDTLSDFNKQTRAYPLNDMSVEELRSYLEENGYRMGKLVDWRFIKKEIKQ